jgi:osmotically inducible protein OsmC
MRAKGSSTWSGTWWRGRPAILGSHISAEAEVPGATPEQLLQCAARASTNCSISKIMRCDITLAARLLP